MNRLKRYTVITLLLLNSSFVLSQENHVDQIIYLNLKLINGQVTLDDYQIVDGKLKQSKASSLAKDDIYLKTVDNKNGQLFEVSIEDPAHLRYEYGKEDGMLGSKIVVQDTARFTVRVPYHPGLHEVQFFRAQKSLLRTRRPVNHEQSMGSISLDLEKEDAQE